MAKVRFYLKAPYKNGDSAIYLILEFNNIRVKSNVGLTIPPQYWDTKTQRADAKLSKNKFAYGEFNKALQDIDTSIQRVLIVLRNDLGRFPNKIEVKAELDRLTDRNQVKPLTLFEFLELLIVERKKDRNSVNTSQQIATVLDHLKAFCKHQKQTTLNFKDINHNFLNNFKTFAYDVKVLNPNTLNKYVNLLKTAMKEAQKRQIHSSTDYQFLSTKKVPTHEIYLTEPELERIYRLDLSDRKGHEAVRNLFIIGCFTGGQRFSDWSKLRDENIFTENGNLFFKFIGQKTERTQREETVLPLTHTYVQEILKHYDNVLPKPLTNQKSNEYLKDIGKMAGIDTPTKDITYPKGIKHEEIVPKYTLITTHTARRSFATNMVNRGEKLHTIRLLTGHSSEKQLEQYLKTSSLENAVSVANSDFYKNTKTE